MIKFLKNLTNNKYFKYSLLGVITFFYFIYFLNSPTIADPDGFYHLKIAQLLNSDGIVKGFPWLEFSTLKDHYVDQSLLYHYVLSLFLKVFTPLFAIKLLTIISATSLIVLIYALLTKYKIKFPSFYIFLLLSNAPFIYRIMMQKASAFALIALIIFLYFLLKNNKLGLLIISFIYTFIHGGYVMLIGIVLIYMFSQSLDEYFFGNSAYDKFLHKMPFFKLKVKRFVKEFFGLQNMFLLALVLLGLAFGILLSPYNKETLYFLQQQFFQIGIVGVQGIQVGGEWLYYPTQQFFINNFLVLLVFVFSIILFFTNKQKQNIISIFYFILSIIFLFFTLKSRRFIEYFVPISIIFSSIVISINFSDLKKQFLIFLQIKFTKIVIAIICTFIIVIVIFQITDFKSWYAQRGIPFERFYNASTWLKANSNKNDIVYNVFWDDFGPLFYHNSYNRYIAGLDPVFSLNYNYDLYKKYEEIAYNDTQINIKNVIKNEFNSKFIIFGKSKTQYSYFKFSTNFDKVYEDKDAIIYKIQ